MLTGVFQYRASLLCQGNGCMQTRNNGLWFYGVAIFWSLRYLHFQFIFYCSICFILVYNWNIDGYYIVYTMFISMLHYTDVFNYIFRSWQADMIRRRPQHVNRSAPCSFLMTSLAVAGPIPILMLQITHRIWCMGVHYA